MPALSDQKHERFCQLVFKGKSDLQAYQEAFGCTYDSAHASACRLRANTGIVERITELQQRVEDKAVLTMTEKLAYLADVVRTPVGDVDEKSPLCESVKPTKFGTEYRMPGKLEAIKLDSLLKGELRENAGNTLLRISIFGAAQVDAGVIDV